MSLAYFVVYVHQFIHAVHQGCSGKNILGHTLRPRVQGAAQAPGGVRGSAPAAEALTALLMEIYAI